METPPNSPDHPEGFLQEPDASFDYELLRGHNRTNEGYKSTEELHTEYVRLTDELILKMTEGVTVTDAETGESHKEPFDYVVYLDKSARPVSWLVKEMWPLLAVDKEGNVPTMPQTRFVNIDRQQWVNSIDPEGKGNINVSAIDASIIRSLRSLFLKDPNDRKNPDFLEDPTDPEDKDKRRFRLTEVIDNAPTQFDGKNVLIVDEVFSSGRTLQYAESFFKRAFSKARIEGTYWMGARTIMKNRGAVGAIANADLPVWYKEGTEYGRGVGNRREAVSQQSDSAVQRLGSWFLSTRFAKPDLLANQLREEIHQLGADVRAGKVFVEPSARHDPEAFDQRALGLNRLSSIEEYVQLKRARRS